MIKFWVEITIKLSTESNQSMKPDQKGIEHIKFHFFISSDIKNPPLTGAVQRSSFPCKNQVPEIDQEQRGKNYPEEDLKTHLDGSNSELKGEVNQKEG